jgi:hypothetical protein
VRWFPSRPAHYRGFVNSCASSEFDREGSADVETAALLPEPGSVVNTGDAGGELTAEVHTLG